MLENQIVRSASVEQAMMQVDRQDYCPNNPYIDAPQSIGFGVTISAPHMHAHALELLKDKLIEGQNALDVGSGSGYLTMCMAIMVGNSGKVVGIEHIPELVNFAKGNIEKNMPDMLQNGRVKFVGK